MQRSHFILGAAVVPIADTISAGAARAADAVAEAPSGIHVTVPVSLKRADVGFNMEHLAFAGDMPVGLAHMSLMMDQFDRTSTPYSMVAVFHGPAGYMLLADTKYDAIRKTQTGNAFQGPLTKLHARGVRLEMCAMTMKALGWTNDDLLPNVGVTTGAEIRLVQLTQMGYTILHP